MTKNNKLIGAIEELKAERTGCAKRIEELDRAIQVLESLGANGHSTPSLLTHSDKEFANTGIAEAAVIMIRRANGPLHVTEIAKGLQDGGYESKAKHPLSSIAPVMYMAAKQGKYGIVSKKKNTYSLKEIEER